MKQMQAAREAEDVACEVRLSAHTIYAWKSKYGWMDSKAQGSTSAPARSLGG